MSAGVLYKLVQAYHVKKVLLPWCSKSTTSKKQPTVFSGARKFPKEGISGTVTDCNVSTNCVRTYSGWLWWLDLDSVTLTNSTKSWGQCYAI